MTYYGRWTYKFEEAVRQGAAGLFVVHETKAAGYPWDVVRNGALKPQFDLRLEDFAAQASGARRMVDHSRDAAPAGVRGPGLCVAASARPRSEISARVPLGIKASVGVRSDVRYADSYNVVGMVRGSARPDEHFVYTAHWDHLGQAAAGRASPARTRFSTAPRTMRRASPR